MNFNQSVLDTIRQRTSWRSYSPEPMAADLKQKLLTLLAEDHQSPFNGKCRFVLMEMPNIDPSEQRQYGTYGFIKGAQYFIIGAVTPSNYDLEHYGYVLEKIILFATEFGLGTCWLGGSFTKSSFSARAHLQSGEFVPAITPIGYPADHRRFTERVMRWSVGAKARKPWETLFFLKDFAHPLNVQTATVFHDALEMVRLAPSARNGQPWRLVIDENTQIVHFFVTAHKDKDQWKIYGFNREDIGIAVCHFDYSMQQIGKKGEWMITKPIFSIPEQYKYVISWKLS